MTIEDQIRDEKLQMKRDKYRTAWTHIWIQAVTEVDVEPNAKRTTNRTRVLVSLY